MYEKLMYAIDLYKKIIPTTRTTVEVSPSKMLELTTPKIYKYLAADVVLLSIAVK